MEDYRNTLELILISESPYYKGTLLWNDLPANTQTSNDVIRFKQMMGLRYRAYEKLI